MTYINQVESKKEVYPVGSFVFYTGDEEWKLPETLKETLKSIPSEMEPNINDWRLPVIDLKTMDARKLTNRRLKDVVEISQSMFAGSYEGLRENRKIETESFMMAVTFTRTNIRREDLPEGDEIDMCEGMERMAEGFRKEGEVRGVIRGRSEGKLEEKQNTLLTLLTCKLGNLSKETENTIRSSTMEKLNKLTLSIFDIQSEEDALRIIN